jgi:hypothetical protein
VLSAYLEAESKTNRLMVLELAKIVLLIGGIAALHQFGVRVASCAVGIAFGTMAVAGVLMVAREGPSPRRLLIGFLQPLAACCVMIVAVRGARDLLKQVDLDHPALLLAAMVITGAVVYAVAALALCRATAQDLLRLLNKAMGRPTGEMPAIVADP